MSTNGMRATKQVSPKTKMKELETTLRNTQMALQMSQMMIKHIADQLSALQNDVGSNMGLLNDFQYRTLAMLEVGKFDKDAVDAKAEELKLIDFNRASDKEDITKGYINDNLGLIEENSIVIATTSTPDTAVDQGIFRTKFPMTECASPELREKLLGKKVGDVIESNIGDTKHTITILGLRKVEQALEESKEQAGE